MRKKKEKPESQQKVWHLAFNERFTRKMRNMHYYQSKYSANSIFLRLFCHELQKMSESSFINDLQSQRTQRNGRFCEKPPFRNLLWSFFPCFFLNSHLFAGEWASSAVVVKRRGFWSIFYRKGLFLRKTHVVCSLIVMCCSKTWMKYKRHFLNPFSSTAMPLKQTQ